MPIVIACPSCKARIKAPEAAVGKNVKCPSCGTAMTVRAPATAPTPTRRDKPLQDEPRRPTKPQPEPDADYEEVEDDPRPRPKSRRRAEEDHEEVAEPRRRANGHAAREEIDEVDEIEEIEETRPRGKGRAVRSEDEEDDAPRGRGTRRGREEEDDLDEEDDRPKKRRGGAVELPQLETTQDERSAAFLFWVLGFIPCVSPIGPIVYWAMKRKELPLLDHQGKQMFNAWLTSFVFSFGFSVVAGIAVTVAGFIDGWMAMGVSGLFGLLGLAYVVFLLVMTITAMLKARAGVWWRFPYTFQVFK